MEINIANGITVADLLTGLLDPNEVERVESQVIDEHCRIAEQQEWYTEERTDD